MKNGSSNVVPVVPLEKNKKKIIDGSEAFSSIRDFRPSNVQNNIEAKSYICNILMGQTTQQIIESMKDIEETSKEKISQEIERYGDLIDGFTNESEIEKHINNNWGNLQLACIDFAKALLKCLGIKEKEQELYIKAARTYAKKYINKYWTRNQER